MKVDNSFQDLKEIQFDVEDINLEEESEIEVNGYSSVSTFGCMSGCASTASTFTCM